MKRFEAYIVPDNNIEVYFPDEDVTIHLNSTKGISFALDLIDLIKQRFPSMLLAIESKFKFHNRTLFSTMKKNPSLYAINIVHAICGCCFGERDHVLDFDGDKFYFERPVGCREAKYCPWNGYNERNKDSFIVICGAKREYGFTHQERRVALLLKSGTVKPEVIAEIMCISQKSVWNLLSSIYKKSGCDNMSDFIVKVKDENI